MVSKVSREKYQLWQVPFQSLCLRLCGFSALYRLYIAGYMDYP